MRLAPGQMVSHYRILDVLGEGGMGIVYRAQDLKLPREVALKFLPNEYLRNAEAKKRFVNEARTASSLQHPNICTIFDIDETTDGQTFIVMPRYVGETLRERLNRVGRLEFDEAVEFTSQLADGLARAHLKRIIHRDIKPENVFITEDGTAILMDFGLAKLAGSTMVTKSGRTVGTIAYMSPEQASGSDVDHRSDIFSLGVVLYEMVTGQRPFNGDHEAAIIYAIINSEPKLVSLLCPDLPAGLQPVVDRALQKRPGDRYGDVLALRDALPGATGPRPSRFGGVRLRRRLVAVSILVLVAALVAVLTRGLWMRSGPLETQDQALAIIGFRDLVDAGDDVAAAGITELVNVGLIESSPIRLISIEYLQDLRRRLFGSTTGAIADDQALEVARKSGATLLLAGSIGKMGGEHFVAWRIVDVKSGASLAARRVRGADLAQMADGVVAGAVPLLEETVGITATNSLRPVTEMTTSNPEAYRHLVSGRQALRESRNEVAVKEFNEALALDSTFALAHFELSRAQIQRDDAAAQKAFQRAWALRSSLGIKDRMRLDAWRERLSGTGRTRVEACRELEARWPDDRDILHDLAEALWIDSYFNESAAVARRGALLYPDDVDLLAWQGRALEWGSRREEALRVAQRVAALEPTNPNWWDDVGLRYLRLGFPDSAETAFHKALRIDPAFLNSREGLVSLAYCRGDVDEAIERMESLLRAADLPPDYVALTQGSRTTVSLAFLYAETGRFSKALSVNEAALDYTSVAGSYVAAQVAQYRIILLTEKQDRAGAIGFGRQLDPYVANVPSRAWSYMELFLGIDSVQAARYVLDELYYPNRHHSAVGYQYFRYRKARLLRREGQPDSALTYFEGVRWGLLDMLPSPHGTQYRHELVRALQAAGRSDEAIAVLRDLVRICGGHALGHYELGKLYEDMTRRVEARKEYETFLDMWSKADEGLPQLTDARKRLNVLGR